MKRKTKGWEEVREGTPSYSSRRQEREREREKKKEKQREIVWDREFVS